MRRSAILAMWLIVCSTGASGQNGAIEANADNKDATADTAQIDKRGRRIVKKNVIKNAWNPPSKRDYQAIALDAGHLLKYAEFLKTPNTGLIRLHDQSKCRAAQGVVNVAEPCPSNFIYGRAASYSFRMKKYRTFNFSDVLLSERAFYAAGINSQSIIVQLGDVALETVSAETAAVKSLREFAPSTDAAEALREAERFAKGMRAGKYVLRKSVVAKPNQTYALRAVAYKSKIMQQRGPFKVNLLDNDKRDDVLIAFRVVGAHDDGSLSLLWKELDRKPAPKLIFPDQPENRTKQKN